MAHEADPTTFSITKATRSHRSQNERTDSPFPLHRASVHGKDTLDISQRLERKLARYNASRNLFKRWLFEIVIWLTSATCMVSCRLLIFPNSILIRYI